LKKSSNLPVELYEKLARKKIGKPRTISDNLYLFISLLNLVAFYIPIFWFSKSICLFSKKSIVEKIGFVCEKLYELVLNYRITAFSLTEHWKQTHITCDSLGICGIHTNQQISKIMSLKWTPDKKAR
jgi:hypothetical protein